MKARLCLLAALVVFLATAVLLQLARFTDRAQSQQSVGVIQPDVLEALQQDSEVAVFISLAPPAALLANVSIDEMRQNTADRTLGTRGRRTGS